MSIIKYSLAASIGILGGLCLAPSLLTSQQESLIQVQPPPEKVITQHFSLEDLVHQRLSSLPTISEVEAGSTYHDPNQTGNPLYVISNPDMQLTPNFKLREFASSGNHLFPYARIDLDLVIALQHLRDAIKKPIIITSGYRSTVRNTQKGGAPSSRHMSGDAVDMSVPGMSPHHLASNIAHLLGDQVWLKVYDDGHVHLDLRYKQRK